MCREYVGNMLNNSSLRISHNLNYNQGSELLLWIMYIQDQTL